MSVLRPVGPLPPRVYWVRRLLLVALVVVIVLLASWAWGAIGSSGSDGGPPAESPGASPTTSPSSSATTSPSPTPSESPSSSPSSSPSGSTAAGPQPCPGKAIAVVASTTKTTYPPNQDPRFTIKVTNTSKKTCTRDVGQRAMELRVNQGDVLIWSSDHCAPGGPSKVVPLKAGQSYTTSVVWSRTESATGCPSNSPEAPAGTYALTGRNLKVISDPTAFALG